MVEELKAMRLCDLDGLTQEEAAAHLGISRRTLWTYLDSARRKVAYAMVNDLPIYKERWD